MITREDIVGKKLPCPTLAVDAPDWGPVHVRKLPAWDVVDFEFMLRENGGRPENYKARLAVRFVCDPHGNRIFKDEDAPGLGKDPAHAAAIFAVFDAGCAFNNLIPEAHEETKKNSGTGPS